VHGVVGHTAQSVGLIFDEMSGLTEKPLSFYTSSAIFLICIATLNFAVKNHSKSGKVGLLFFLSMKLPLSSAHSI